MTWYEIISGINVLPVLSIFCVGAAAGIGVCVLSVLYDQKCRRRRKK